MHAAIPAGADRSMERASAAVRDDLVTGFRWALLVGAVFLALAAAVAGRIPAMRLGVPHTKESA